MNTISYTQTDIAGNLGYTWNGLTADDVGVSSAHSGTADRTVQVGGTFGAGSVVIEGSLDGLDWHTLHDVLGVALSFSQPGLKAVLENVVFMRPRSINATAVNVILNVRR